jgi:hypothetical protein
MSLPTASARAELDSYILQLGQFSEGFTLDDFRSAQILRAQRVSRFVRICLLWSSGVFLILALGVLAAQTMFPPERNQSYDLLSAAVWALGLGGLGAVSNIFTSVIKLIPEEILRQSDEFEVIARLILGCLFSTIITVTLLVNPMTAFFHSLHIGGPTENLEIKGGIQLIVPFLAGYSLPMVLRILEKTIRAVELTIGAEDRREMGAVQQRPPVGRNRRRTP